MNITKYGHCCLLIEINNVYFLTDPGVFSQLPDTLPRVDYVVITHEHADHVHMDSLKRVLDAFPSVKVISNRSVSKLLEGVCPVTCVEDGQTCDCGGVSLKGCGTTHAIVHESITPVQNTGYFFGDKLFYPGDAFTNPGASIDVLALPTAGPWMKLSEALAYAHSVAPRVVVPVHDGIYVNPDMMNGVIRAVLEKQGTLFTALPHGEVVSF